MGACISLNGTLLKKTKHNSKSKPPQPLPESISDSKSRNRTTRVISVLKDPSAEDIFKKYRFGNELGRGEFGITYQCCDIVTGEILACKTISKSKLKTEIDVEDVRREVEIMRHLPKHENIVRYKDAYEDREAVYLVMELCQGGELFDRIVARGHYTERGAATITKTILEVVKVCHAHGVIHRDLKPENFLYADASENSRLKAIDFGLSIFFEPGQRFGEIVGSPYYMAPEVLRRNYGPEVDIWSAGVILYILLCGVPPFWAETEEGIAQAIVKCEIDFKRDPWPKVSEDAKELVKGMLDPNPYNRMTVEEALEHRWIHNAHQVPNVPLGENVRTRIKQFSLMNKFKRKVLRVVADNLPQEEVAGIKQMFHMMDTDKNGNLTFEELKDGLQMIGQPVADPDVRMLMDAADIDGNGTLNCEEFVTMSVHLKKIGSGDEQLRQAFRYFDKNDNGYIEIEELKEGLLEDNLGPNNDQVIQDIIFDVDLDKDGRVSYKEFEAMMTTGVEWRMASRQYSRAMLNALSQRMFKENSLHLKN
ncbi:calcium-dependent protein kinase 24 [Camellia sinensis]|uniref:calcium-dependent protein kinase 24 n=1 Tax=Camellia sinensis TaxID=4442 RepID=UPI001036EA62|nr:calcium-dependent protein kinase 24 [Camellia sinensis]